MDGLHAMFKHHFIWIAKDISAGYQPDADMYADPPSAGPTPPKGKPTQPRARARPEPAAGAAAGALAAEEEGDAAATSVERWKSPSQRARVLVNAPKGYLRRARAIEQSIAARAALCLPSIGRSY